MLKIGIVGINFKSKKHIEALLLLKNSFSLVGYYDPNMGSGDESSFDLRCFDSYESLLNEVDVVDIVSPLYKHFEFISIALRKSKHIFIEKPVTESEDEGRSLISLSSEADVKVQISSEEKFNPAFEAANKFFHKPMLIDFRRSIDVFNFIKGQCLVLDYMLSDIDLVLSVIKSGVKKISANALSVSNKSVDLVDVRLEFDNGAIAKLHVDKIGGGQFVESKFYQLNNLIEINFTENNLKVFSEEVGGFNKETFSFQDVNSIKNEFISFYDSIVNDKETKVSLLNGLDSLMVAKKILDLINRTNIAYIDNNN